MSIRRAVLIGMIVVNGPVFALLVASIYLPVWFIPQLGAWALLLFLFVFSLAWLWWSLSVPRWRVWAFERVDSIAELKLAAVAAGVIWPDGHFFGRTEIKSGAIRDRENHFARTNG